jgi:uncharacterized protein YjfI (DUF2170 family)
VSDGKVKGFLDSLLTERANDIANQISSSEDLIFSELEKIKKINSDFDYTIPPELTVDNSGADKKISIIHEYTMLIAESMNQLKLINTLLDGINHFCSRSAIFLLRDDKLVGWSGKGFTENKSEIKDREIKKMFVSLSANTTFKYVITKKETYIGKPMGHRDNNLIFDRFGTPLPQEVLIMPFFVKGKPQAVIYSDRINEEDGFDKKEIGILTKIGEMSLDLLPLKQKIVARVKTQKFLDSEDDEQEKTLETEKSDPEITENNFASDTIQISKENQKAQRYARVTISDIILYNKDKVEEARENKVLGPVLKDTIMQARDSFLTKYNEIEFFEKELLETLAQGDRGVLKGYKFETI